MSKSSDTITTITQDDLHHLRDQLRDEFKQGLDLLRTESTSASIHHTQNQDATTERMNELIAANKENNHRIHELVSAFQTFQTTLLRTLGVTQETIPLPTNPNTHSEGRKRDTVSTPVHKNSPSDTNLSTNSSPFLTPSSQSNTSKKRLKGFNANRLYFPEHDVTANLSTTFDAIMSSEQFDTDQPAISQAGPHKE